MNSNLPNASKLNEQVMVSLEFTPNPNTLKFVVNRQFLERGAANFITSEKAQLCPLAQNIFKVPGISQVMIGTNFITITKADNGDWDVIAEETPKTIENFILTGQAFFSPDWFASETKAAQIGGSEIENKIRAVLDSEIRPAVAMDGGDITFDRFENGIVYLQLQGACSSCPSSIATLKMGVETRLKEAIPEVREVVQV